MGTYTSKKLLCTIAALPVFLLVCPFTVSAERVNAVAEDQTTLIIYYSRTGTCRIVSDMLKQSLDADVLEVFDQKDRSGRWGYFTAGLDSMLNRYTDIEPSRPDLDSYKTFIIVSPVWNWKLSVPIRTLMHGNRFDGRDLIFFTTGNNEVMKYEKYDDNAPFLKRYLRDYLRKKCEATKLFVQTTGGSIAGYYHVATKNRTLQDIELDIQKHAAAIKQRLDTRLPVSMAKHREDAGQ